MANVRDYGGSMHLRVTGAQVEAFVNALAQEGIPFRQAELIDRHEMRMHAPISAEGAIARCAKAQQCEIKILKRRGVLVWVGVLKKRVAFLFGLLFFLLAITVSGFVLTTIEVKGNETISDEQILSVLQDLGMRRGMFTLQIDEATLARELMMQLEDLTWCAINLHGTHADVLVREEIAVPDAQASEIAGDIHAEASGIIESIETYTGQAQVIPGSVVAQGDLLITGTYPKLVPQYSPLEGTQFHVVHAQGRILARTWRTISASIPLSYEHKQPTGAQQVRFALILPNQRVNFYQNSGISYATCDKITKVYEIPFLPVSLVRETYRQYETQTRPIKYEQALALLQEQLAASLQMTIGEEGEICSMEFTQQEVNGILTVTLLGECREEIGVFVPYD